MSLLPLSLPPVPLRLPHRGAHHAHRFGDDRQFQIRLRLRDGRGGTTEAPFRSRRPRRRNMPEHPRPRRQPVHRRPQPGKRFPHLIPLSRKPLVQPDLKYGSRVQLHRSRRRYVLPAPRQSNHQDRNVEQVAQVPDLRLPTFPTTQIPPPREPNPPARLLPTQWPRTWKSPAARSGRLSQSRNPSAPG